MSHSDEMRRERERTGRLLDEMDRIRELRAEMANLSACLRDAGALCAAYEQGLYEGQIWEGLRSSEWHPGCGREAEH